jgi:hypothetical protein
VFVDGEVLPLAGDLAEELELRPVARMIAELLSRLRERRRLRVVREAGA